MSTLLILNGRLLDPASGVDAEGCLLIEDGRIVSAGPKPSRPAEKTIDARGLLVVPGLIDMHVHLREPGREDKESIAAGAEAAVRGGFASVACMANTEPPIDHEAIAAFVVARARDAGFANVFPVGAVTKGMKGEELTEMTGLVRGGAVAFSDDGLPVQSADLLAKALRYARMVDKVIISHAEDRTLSAGGAMNEGAIATRLGLPGNPRLSEEVMVSRDVLLARGTGGRIHIAHLSCAAALEWVRRGKAGGVAVTAEVTPHHLVLTEEALTTYDTNCKMAPPLRTREDIAALIAGLKDGTIDAIASDHAPHTREEKDLEFARAPNGIVGLETTVGVLGAKIAPDVGWPRLIRALTVNPARILGIPKGTLAPGADADVTLIDPAAEWTIDPAAFRSKGRNTPFAGWKVKGRVRTTIVGGRVFDLS